MSILILAFLLRMALILDCSQWAAFSLAPPRSPGSDPRGIVCYSFATLAISLPGLMPFAIYILSTLDTKFQRRVRTRPRLTVELTKDAGSARPKGDAARRGLRDRRQVAPVSFPVCTAIHHDKSPLCLTRAPAHMGREVPWYIVVRGTGERGTAFALERKLIA